MRDAASASPKKGKRTEREKRRCAGSGIRHRHDPAAVETHTRKGETERRGSGGRGKQWLCTGTEEGYPTGDEGHEAKDTTEVGATVVDGRGRDDGGGATKLFASDSAVAVPSRRPT